MIKSVIFDIDGVLTDGKILVNSRGEEFKVISFVDIDAFFELKRSGIKVGFISGENTAFCKYVKERFSPDFLISGCKDKLSAFKELSAKYGFGKTDTVFVGDSEKDIPLLKYLKNSFTPRDANKKVRNAAGVVLKSKRGQGVISEVVDYVSCNRRLKGD
ncbi:MAG: HAD hydrolase family protein [Elusimicrobia bacterium]|nr:HAD hydrolase family protein [Elusimicrobiota bacterium]